MVAAGLVLGLSAQGALAQNSAQRAALARLKSAHAGVHALDTSSGSSEAANAALNQPTGLAYDSIGDIFIADSVNNLIREVDLNGIIRVVAGTGEQGFGGDGGAATSALLDTPTDIAVDAAGNIYIADTHNNRIRKVSGGTITTIAGTGMAGFSGDGATATTSALNQPTAIAVDSHGNIYIADTMNHRIREIAGTTISTVAGNGDQIYSGDGGLATAAGLDSPNGVAVDAAFNLYIGDTHNQRVRMVTYSTGLISTLAGNGVKGFTADGTASTAKLARPRGIAVDTAGAVYVADSDNHRIRAISGGQVATIAGNGEEGYTGDTGVSTGASLDTPSSVAVYGGSLAVADTNNQVIRTVTASGVNTTAGTPTKQKESLQLSGATTVGYGTGTLSASFSNGSNTAIGLVTFYDGLGSSPALAGTAPLSANTAILNTSQLAVGTHALVASYPGDSNNPAITSSVYMLVVTPVQLTAVANSVSLLYGQTIPTLSGTLSGVLQQDAGKVSASYATAATATSVPGTYPVSVTLTGSGARNYTVILGSTTGSVAIAQAPSTIKLSPFSQTPIVGSPVTLTATVASTTSGTPAGTVNFYDGATLLNATPASLNGGVASLALTTLPVGAQNFTAVYSGSTNFFTSTSSTLTATVLSPDFTIAITPKTQMVLPRQSANYTIALTPANATFVYPVSLSVSGLPAGVTASFTPSSVATGAAATSTVLTLRASAQAQMEKHRKPWGGMATSTALALLLLPMVFSRRTRRTMQQLSRAGRVLIALFVLAMVSALTGCGGHSDHASTSYTVTVTAVCGPVTHTADVTLTVH